MYISEESCVMIFTFLFTCLLMLDYTGFKFRKGRKRWLKKSVRQARMLLAQNPQTDPEEPQFLTNPTEICLTLRVSQKPMNHLQQRQDSVNSL